MTMTRRELLLSSAAMTLAASTSHAQAAFPSKPIKMIVPFAPGGSNDFIARALGPRLATQLGQPVVVDNRSGAGGSIGAQAVARAEPDGYTVLSHSSSFVVNPHLTKNPGYDALRDFTPVSLVAETPLVVVVHPSVPAKTFPEFLAWARRSGSEVFYGSGGIGSAQHLALELFNVVAGTKIKHIPYRGSGPVVAALLAGEVHCSFDIIPSAKPLAESGKVRALAVTSPTRTPTMAELPTVRESGVADFDFLFWQGLLLPRSSPTSIVDKWHAAVEAVLAQEQVKARLSDQGYQTIGSSPAQFAETLQQDFSRWARVIADAGIKPE